MFLGFENFQFLMKKRARVVVNQKFSVKFDAVSRFSKRPLLYPQLMGSKESKIDISRQKSVNK